MDFSKSEANADPERATYVLASKLVSGDRIMVRCVTKHPQTRVELVFDEDRIVKTATKERGRVYVKLEPKVDAQSEFDVEPMHRFVAVSVANPITIKSQRR